MTSTTMVEEILYPCLFVNPVDSNDDNDDDDNGDRDGEDNADDDDDDDVGGGHYSVHHCWH